jgi:LysM repeat protein
MVGAATLTARGWRPLVGPVAFLLAATIAVGLVRGHLGRGQPSAASSAKRTPAHVKPVHHAAHVLYLVRAGDTLDAIASRTGTTTAVLLKLNPKVSPTALFIGERLRLK